uniref:Delta(24)-sterol reductase n=1 Tax=Brassica campestris TaxID=3711 RepID=M4DQP5_BRACM
MSDLEAPLVRPKRKKIWVDYFIQFRWIVVIFIVLPISATLYFLTYLGDVWSETKSYEKRQKEHDQNVNKVIKRLKGRDASKDGLVCTARKPWIAVGMRNVDYKRARHFEISRVTVPMNLSLAVVAELDDLTVGGLINGYGIEGSSHVHGLFTDTVEAYEIVLAGGELVRATRDNEYSDLFYAIPWSQGTLGLLVAAEIRLVHIKEYMKLTYIPVKGDLQTIAQGYMDSFAPRDRDPAKIPDFVEGMVYSPSEGVMMTGTYASREEAKRKGNKINNVGWWFKPWFYQYAQTALKKGEFVEYIPTREYYHRHTSSLYWEGKLILPFGDQFWFRFLFGWLMPPKVSLLKATQGEAIRNYYHEMHVIQDMLVPLYKVGDALKWVDREMEVYPLWLCPHKLFKQPVKSMINPEPGFEYEMRQGDTEDAQMYTDVGVYYAPGPVLRGEVFDGVEAVRKMEQWLIENHGYQPQYAVSELDERSFWRMFDADLYEHCRRKYRAVGTFMSIYYKSKKGRKTEKEVREAEQAHLETAYAEGD